MQATFRYAAKGLKLCHIWLIVAATLGVVGGVETFVAVNDEKTLTTGRSLRQASSMLLLAVLLILVAVTVGILARINQAWVGDRRIVYAAVISFPFLLVRVVYTIIPAFDTLSSTFNYTKPNVLVEAFMVRSVAALFRFDITQD